MFSARNLWSKRRLYKAKMQKCRHDRMTVGQHRTIVNTAITSDVWKHLGCRHSSLITEVYGTEAMSDSKARKLVRKFKDERTNVHDEERSGRPSAITDDLMQGTETKIRENRRFKLTTFS
ncbi:hypothetical protein TNCV_3243431 [Trichonephila clavipes]|nr:hypothetical protein TNCV_3243431 [Trichonephila clavipes]